MLTSLGRFIVRMRYAVVGVYAVLVPLAAWYGSGVLHELQPGGFRDPKAESSIAAELSRHFVAGDLVVLYTAHQGENAPGTVDDILAYTSVVPALERAAADPSVERVVSFYSTSAPWLISRDRTRTVALITLRGTDIEKVRAADRLKPTFAADGFDVGFGGYAPVFEGITSTVEHDLRRAELLALPLTLLLLLLLFRSVVSAAIPCILGGIAIAFSLAILRFLHTFTDVTIFAANVATILGLGLAIDYSLFVLMRFREELPKAGEHRAVLRSIGTAGRAVAFSGVTVAVSLLGLFMFPHGVLRSVAVGGVAVTIATVILALTLLPALVSLVGTRVDAMRVPFGLPLPSEIDDEKGAWHRLSMFVLKRPLVVGVVVVVALVCCAVPFVRLAPSISDARALPSTDDARLVQEIVDHEFQPHLTTPHEILVVRDDGTPWDKDGIVDLIGYAKRLSGVPGLQRVAGLQSVYPGEPEKAAKLILADDAATRAFRATFLDGSVARLSAVSELDVDDERALEQVDLLRRVTPPPHTHVLVGGQSAWVADVRDAIRTHTPAMVAFIAVIMVLVLFLVFGSLVLPVKAIAMNLLSLTASFGAIVWVFQDGRFRSLFAYEPLVPSTTDASVPVLMFAIVFGLSMDYEVLLLSRVREEYLRTGDNSAAVARGLARTGRLITSAALLLVVVVSCFATSRLVLIKTLAVGIAVAITLDAAVVRTLLVPATMQLLGDWNWWAPRWLTRLRPPRR